MSSDAVVRCDAARLERLQSQLVELPERRAWSAAATVNLALETLGLALTSDAGNGPLRAWYERQTGAQFGSGLDAARRRLMIAAAELERAAAQYGE